jgi:hypothetical protein
MAAAARAHAADFSGAKTVEGYVRVYEEVIGVPLVDQAARAG